MRVSAKDVICGIPAPLARQLMRKYWRERPAAVACDILGVDSVTARTRLADLEIAGFLRCVIDSRQDPWWITTTQGNALAQASFGRPITRKTADRLLQAVVGRVRTYNADPSFLLTVAELAVFGSYLDPSADRLGDVDIAATVARREADGQQHVEKVLDYGNVSGRYFATFTDQLHWPRKELFLALKARSTAISLTTEDVSALTDRFEVIYRVSEDPGAIAPPLPLAIER